MKKKDCGVIALWLFAATILMTVIPNRSIAGDYDIIWSFQTSTNFTNMNRGTPAIDHDGNIYFASPDGCLYSINSDGNQRWKAHVFDSGSRTATPISIGPNNEIYNVGSTTLYSFSQDGTMNWSFPLDECSNPGVAISPSGILYLGTDTGSFYAIKPDGLEKWSIQLTGSNTESGITIAPAVAEDGTIYTVASDILYALNSDGSVKWELALESNVEQYSSFALDDDGTIYFGTSNGFLYAVNPDGSKKWAFDSSSLYSDGTFSIQGGPVINGDGTIFFPVYDDTSTNAGRILGFNKNGEHIYTNRSSTEGYHGDICITPALDSLNDIWFGDSRGRFYSCGCNEDNYTNWVVAPGGVVKASPALDDKGHVYFVGSDGTLYCIDTTASNHLADSPWPKFGMNNQNTHCLATTTVWENLPVPDIKINGADEPVTLSEGSSISVTISLDPGKYEGQKADWWIVAKSSLPFPYNRMSYIYPTGWETGINLSDQKSLSNIDSLEVLNTESLSSGSYIFYFVVDKPDEMLQGTFKDSVKLEIQ